MPGDIKSTSKIAIVGAGSVGATIAYASMIRGVGNHIALYDTNRTKVDAEVLDLAHGLQFVPMARIEGSDDIKICADASKPGGSCERHAYMKESVRERGQPREEV